MEPGLIGLEQGAKVRLDFAMISAPRAGPRSSSTRRGPFSPSPARGDCPCLRRQSPSPSKSTFRNLHWKTCGAALPDPLARRDPGVRLEVRGQPGVRKGIDRPLAGRFRLAPAGAAPQRVSPVPGRARRHHAPLYPPTRRRAEPSTPPDRARLAGVDLEFMKILGPLTDRPATGATRETRSPWLRRRSRATGSPTSRTSAGSTCKRRRTSSRG